MPKTVSSGVSPQDGAPSPGDLPSQGQSFSEGPAPRFPFTRRLWDTLVAAPWRFLRQNWAEIAKFLAVGCANYVVDLAVFNLFLLWIIPRHPVSAKVIGAAVATLFSWFASRAWTFKGKGGRSPFSELMLFIAANLAGLLPALCCLWISHYLLGLTSALADNISANVLGLILGTIVRYFTYRLIVFSN